MTTAYVGLGSNVDPEENLKIAAEQLRRAFPTISFSAVYRTAPREYEEQDAFLNAVGRVETEDSPEEVVKTLRGIEGRLGKSVPFRFGPRTIDLDLLLYGDEIVQTDDLEIPHPRMHERRFVLEPLCEFIDVQGQHPVLNESYEALLKKTLDQACDRTEFTL